MSTKKEYLGDKIDQLIKAGNFSHAREEIAKFEKISPLSDLDRIQLSIWHVWTGEVLKGRKVLGELKSEEELLVSSEVELARHSRIAYLYFLQGARFVAKRIFDQIENSLKKQNKNLKKIYPKHYHQMGNLYNGSYDYQKAYDNYVMALSIINRESVDYHLCRLGLCDALGGLGRKDEAINLMLDEIAYLKEHNHTHLLSFALRNLGETYFMFDDYKNAQLHFSESEKYIPLEEGTKETAFLYKFYGALKLIEGDKSCAKDYLEKAIDYLITKRAQAISILSVIYWLEQLYQDRLEFKHKALLRLHHSYSPYQFLVGKKMSKFNQIPLHPWFQKRLPKTTHDCWLVVNNQIQAFDYHSYDYQTPTIDLVAGLIRLDDNLDQLTQIETATLIALWGAGYLGINEWALSDFVYQENFYLPEQGIERMRKVISKLKKRGLEINKDKSFYQAYIPKNYTLLFPMSPFPLGKIAYLKSFKKDNPFTRAEVENIFGITKSTAHRWIQDWLNDKKIKDINSHEYQIIF